MGTILQSDYKPQKKFRISNHLKLKKTIGSKNGTNGYDYALGCRTCANIGIVPQ